MQKSTKNFFQSKTIVCYKLFCFFYNNTCLKLPQTGGKSENLSMNKITHGCQNCIKLLNKNKPLQQKLLTPVVL